MSHINYLFDQLYPNPEVDAMQCLKFFNKGLVPEVCLRLCHGSALYTVIEVDDKL